MGFEWDPKKEAANLRKHGVAFQDAVGIFDGLHLEQRDDRDYSGEERFVVAGEVKECVLIVVYAWRSGGSRRIISARKATKAEREEFYRALHQP